MAYKTTISKACTNREAAVTEIHNQLIAMGWTHVDGMCDSYDIPYTDVNISDETFTMSGHTYSNSQPVHIRTTGTVPGGLAINTQYYVCTVVSGVSFKLSTTYNGSAINLTSQGSGTHTISESFRVYKSNAEASDQIYQYVRLSFMNNPTKIYLFASYMYDIVTRAPYGNSYSFASIDTNQTGFYLWIHGDKDKVHITTKVASTYYRFWFGFMKSTIPLKTTVSGSISSGSNIVIPVVNSTGFDAGDTCQIIGAYYEGRDTLTTTAVGSGTITVSSLPRNYAAGAIIGYVPLSFGFADVNNFYMTCPHAVAGLNNSGYGFGAYGTTAMGITALDPDTRTGKYVLQPLVVCANDTNSSNTGTEGYINTNMLIAPTTGMIIEDTFAVGRLSYGTSSGSNDSTTLNDTTKSWTTNAYAGKVVIITFGAGSGMIKKIESNTATALTLSSGWTFETTPDATSQYTICEEGYRYMAHGTGTGSANQMALREGI